MFIDQSIAMTRQMRHQYCSRQPYYINGAEIEIFLVGNNLSTTGRIPLTMWNTCTLVPVAMHHAFLQQ
jgi:hypothetical protein